MMTESDRKDSGTTINITSIPFSNPKNKDHDGNNEGDFSASTSTMDASLVDWTGPNDPDMPLNWPKYRKVSMIAVVTACRFTS